MILILIPLRLSIPKYSTYPACLVVWSCFVVWWVLIPTRVDSFYGWRNVVCPYGIPATGDTSLELPGHPCTVSGAFNLYAINGWVFSWCMIAVHGALSVTAPSLLGRPSMIITYVAIILFPLPFVIATVVAGQWSMNPLLPICLVAQPKPWAIASQFIPIDILCFIGLIATAIIVIRLFQSQVPLGLTIKANLRILLFLFGVSIWVITLSAFTYSIIQDSPLFVAAFQSFTGCSFTSPNCDRGYVFPNTAQAVIACLVGWYQILAFGTNAELYTTPFSERQNVWKGFKQMFVVQTSASSTSTTQGSSSSSSGSSSLDTETFMSDLQ